LDIGRRFQAGRGMILVERDVIRVITKRRRGGLKPSDFGFEAGKDYRIIGKDSGKAWLIDLEWRNIRIIELEVVRLNELHSAGSIALLTEDKRGKPTIEGKRTPKQEQLRDERMRLIAPLLNQVPTIFHSAPRGHEVSRLSKISNNKCAKTINETLRLYWVNGMTPDALLPRFERIGRGRPRETKNTYKLLGSAHNKREETRQRGINITAEVQDAFEKATNRHYRPNERMSLSAVWNEAVADLATTRTIDPKTKQVTETLDEDKLKENAPTYRQFRYWYANSGRFLTDKESRVGASRFAKSHRATPGSSKTYLKGIGSRFEVDATLLDVACVSERNRRRYVGRPTLHIVTDVYSKMIVGFYLGFLSSGWEAATLALRNVVEDKVAFCAKYGVVITDAQWPCSGFLPARILADRGEYEGYNATELAKKTGIAIEVTAPYRGDLKGTVEKRFHMIHELLVSSVPGAVTKNYAEKGDKDYRRHAKLNLRELTEIIIHIILYLNNQHNLTNHHRSAAMFDEEVPPVPAKMWAWAMNSGRVELHRMWHGDVRIWLLPIKTANVARHGLEFRGIQYHSKTAMALQWPELARTGRKPKNPTISYDPNSTDEIYLHLDDGTYEICPISDVSEKFASMTFVERENIRKIENEEKLNDQGDDVLGKRQLRRNIERIILTPNAESEFDLTAESISGASKFRSEEVVHERRQRAAWSKYEDAEKFQSEEAGEGFDPFFSEAFEEDPIDLGDDDD
jgi:putative transposase